MYEAPQSLPPALSQSLNLCNDPIQIISSRRQKSFSASRRAISTIACLGFLHYVLPTLPTEALEEFLGDSICFNLWRAKIVLIVVLCGSLCDAVLHIGRKEQFTDLKMTPHQRKLLGLDPNVPTEKNAVDCTPKRRAKDAKTAKHATTTDFDYTPSRYTRYGNKSSTPLQNVSLSSSPYRNCPEAITDVTSESPVSPLTLSYLFSKSPSAALDKEPIRSSTYFDGLIDEQFNSTKYRPSLADVKPSYPPLPPYQTACQSPSRYSDTWKYEHLIGGLPIIDPPRVLQTEKIELHIDRWTENTREWFANHLLKPIADMFDVIDTELEANNLGHLNSKSAVAMDGKELVSAFSLVASARSQGSNQSQSNAGGNSIFGSSTGGGGNLFGGSSTGQSSSLFGGGKSTFPGFGAASTASQQQNAPQNLVDLARQYPKWSVTIDRLRLEKYLSMPGYQNARGYLRSRIQALANGVMVSAYKWDSGGPEWSADCHPTDAQLVLHIFCSFMDLSMPGENAAEEPFTSRYYVSVEGKPDSRKSVQIKQTKKSPPHFCLVVGNVCWDSYPRHNNVFQTICLFSYYVIKNCAGYLQLLNMGGKTVQISDIFD